MTLNDTHSGIFPSARQFVSSVYSRTILAKHKQCFLQSRLLTGCLETSKIFTRCYCTDWGDSIRIKVVYQHRSIALRHAVKVQNRAGISENIKPLGNLSRSTKILSAPFGSDVRRGRCLRGSIPQSITGIPDITSSHVPFFGCWNYVLRTVEELRSITQLSSKTNCDNSAYWRNEH